jgi:hypothetical protein
LCKFLPDELSGGILSGIYPGGGQFSHPGAGNGVRLFIALLLTIKNACQEGAGRHGLINGFA